MDEILISITSFIFFILKHKVRTRFVAYRYRYRLIFNWLLLGIFWSHNRTKLANIRGSRGCSCCINIWDISWRINLRHVGWLLFFMIAISYLGILIIVKNIGRGVYISITWNLTWRCVALWNFPNLILRCVWWILINYFFTLSNIQI